MHKRATQTAHNGYKHINRLSGGSLTILYRAIKRFDKARGAQAAAAIAFFAFFSLFPLLLVLVSIASNFLKGEEASHQIFLLVSGAIPVSQRLVENNIERLVARRGAVGVLSLIGLFWSASAVFNNLSYNINLAWPQGQRRSFVQNRLVAFAIIAVLTAMLGLSFILDTLTKLLPSTVFEHLDSNFLKTLSNSLPIGGIFLLLTGIYRWVPKRRPRWKAVLISAIIAAISWQAATYFFTWYLGSGLVQYSLVYGSLATVVALLFVIFILNWIVLFGGHLCATIDLEITHS